MSDYLDPHTVCGTHCEPGECPGYKPKPLETRAWNAAFDDPTTPDQALAVLVAWGDPLTSTFSARRAKMAADLLTAAPNQLRYVEHVYRYIDGLMEKEGAYKFMGEQAGFILEGLPQIFPNMVIPEAAGDA